MIKTMNPCTECGNTFFDTCTVDRKACCTNCNHRVSLNTRKVKGHYITSCTTRFGETYFLTKKGWINMTGMDTKKNTITYARITTNIKFWLANAPYGTESIETKFYDL